MQSQSEALRRLVRPLKSAGQSRKLLPVQRRPFVRHDQASVTRQGYGHGQSLGRVLEGIVDEVARQDREGVRVDGRSVILNSNAKSSIFAIWIRVSEDSGLNLPFDPLTIPLSYNFMIGA